MKLNSFSSQLLVSIQIFIGLACGALAFGETSKALREDSSFSITVTTEPRFPLRLKTDGITQGSVTFQLVVDQFGELRDALMIEATHPDFGKEVLDIIYEWKFGVPRINGEAVAMVQNLEVNFESTGNVFTYTTGNLPGSGTLFRKLDEQRNAYKIALIDEIDTLPLPTHIETPVFSTEMLNGRDDQKAVFEFYIDESGNVRIPMLREAEASDDIEEELLVIVQDALMKWKFRPPKKNGKPVVVRVAQPIFFRTQNAIFANTLGE